MLYTQCKKCKAKIPYKTTYCDECKGITDREKKARYNRYNKEDKIRQLRHTTKWRKLRLKILDKSKGLCYICYIKGEYKPAEHIHHIEPANQRIDLFYDEANLIPLCEDCHVYVHRHRLENRNSLIKYVKSLKE